MLYFIGWLAVGATGAWAAFYCLRRAKGSLWAHWMGFGIAAIAGFGMIGTMLDGAVHWAANGVVLGGAGILTLGLGLPMIFDIVKDRKPDTIALIAALILPSILALGISQLSQFVGNSFDHMKSTRVSVESKVK
jgi:NO-binding membrane sensor protein with MHYT domain